MRKLLPLAIITLTTLIISCQKEISGDVNPQAVTGNFKAKINGEQWVANKMTSGTRLLGLINVTGLSNDKKMLTITLTDSGAHTYTLDQNSMNAAAYIDSNLANKNAFTTNQGLQHGDAGGTVTITNIDATNKKISGTFNFKVFRQEDGQQRVFTEGSFTDLSYVTSLPPTGAGDTLRVKVNGTLWNATVVFGANQMNMLTVSGTDATISRSIGFQLPPTITPGSYPFDIMSGIIGAYNPDTDPNHSKLAVSGTLQILEHNTTTKRLRANFNFVGAEILNPLNTVTLTEGYFSLKYN